MKTKYFLKFTLKLTLEPFHSKCFATKNEAMDYYWDHLRGKITTFTLCTK